MFYIGKNKKALSLGPKPKSRPAFYTMKPKEYVEACTYFYAHAWFFLKHADIILKDSRLYLAHVPAHNGLMYSGDFPDGNLWVYLQWWLNGPECVRTDEEGNPALTVQFGGSELSGLNECFYVRPDGRIEEYRTSNFSKTWLPFSKTIKAFAAINHRKGKVFTLQQVVRFLERKDRIINKKNN